MSSPNTRVSYAMLPVVLWSYEANSDPIFQGNDFRFISLEIQRDEFPVTWADLGSDVFYACNSLLVQNDHG